MYTYTCSYLLRCFHQFALLSGTHEGCHTDSMVSNHDSHFFIKEDLTEIKQKYSSYNAVIINFFRPCFKKSYVDGVFGISQQMLEGCLPSTGASALREVVHFLQDKSANLGLNHTQKHFCIWFRTVCCCSYPILPSCFESSDHPLLPAGSFFSLIIPDMLTSDRNLTYNIEGLSLYYLFICINSELVLLPRRGDDYAAHSVTLTVLSEERMGPTSQQRIQPSVIGEHLNILLTNGITYLRARFADPLDG